MTQTKSRELLDFKPFSPSDRELYEERLFESGERGCEFSFANLYLWGEQKFADIHGQTVILSRFGKNTVYPYPVGAADKRAAIDSVIADAAARGIPCRISGVTEDDKRTIEELYQGTFSFFTTEAYYDYVYSIDDLAELEGKKYHNKRTHLNRFFESHPDAVFEPLCETNLADTRKMAAQWYDDRIRDNPDADFSMEREALFRALRDFEAIGMVGLVMKIDGKVAAFTLGCRLSHDTFDVNFEKARHDVNGAYTAINREFARYIREKYPSVRYLDREEDMGIDGLRRAKRSYHPHHMIKKYRACLCEVCNDDD